MGRRWLLVGTVVLAVAQCALWLFSASVMWSLRNLGFPAYQAEHNARFALALFVVAAINALAVIAFLGRRRERGWLVLAAVQLGNIPSRLATEVSVRPIQSAQTVLRFGHT
jgi:hypothetical protein